jgi:hypothetical protein
MKMDEEGRGKERAWTDYSNGKSVGNYWTLQ